MLEFLTVKSSQLKSNYCNIHKSTKHWHEAFPPYCHLLRVDNKLKCCRANKHKDIHWEAHTHKQTTVPTHKLSRPLGHAVWVKAETGRGWAAAGAMGWVGPYGEQRRAAGGLGDGGSWGGLQGDPEPGAACLIGAHLHSSGAGDTWRAFPALPAKWFPLPVFLQGRLLFLFILLFQSQKNHLLFSFVSR